jgi:SAM-dependent methyltransferase
VSAARALHRASTRATRRITGNYLSLPTRLGFKRHELQRRYDVRAIREDEWHAYCGEKTQALVRRHLSSASPSPSLLLNAGSGVYQIAEPPWTEFSLDLFATPLRNRAGAVCATVESLPFRASTFGAGVCVGEVLAYCDPARAIGEFSRVLPLGGTLIVDFRSTRSARNWFKPPFARAADIVADDYNGTVERTWIYDPNYIESLLMGTGFQIREVHGSHTWSALGRRIGLSTLPAVRAQRLLEWFPLPRVLADLTTIVAARS